MLDDLDAMSTLGLPAQRACRCGALHEVRVDVATFYERVKVLLEEHLERLFGLVRVLNYLARLLVANVILQVLLSVQHGAHHVL